ncbi:F-box protein [Aspergillus ibericus CBS 121593]|uniref:Uncharacterized protein n=1 Tax=Aspergillus ibericus CBS 121593 TaxID=1448316 RepID=A0A395GJ94_9EURO|nr:hypothetical protein BO80DRAFT_369125 [Aspergillus ibericus CBS 121593]RAK95276.1 hypothetical protein BO80DRAFT_369125 [Aspergillus ibericus CBS 121593]
MLDRISSEILLQIIPFLTPSDYNRCVLVCKDWYTVFIPYLYHHVSLPLNDYCHISYPRVPNSLVPVRRFAQVIIQNPSLAPLVRSLELYPSDCRGKWLQLPPLAPVAEEQYRHFMLPHGETRLRHRRKFHAWRRDLKEASERREDQRVLFHYEDAWLALLLVQVRNLEKLGIALPEERWILGFYDGPTPPKNSPHLEQVIEWARHPKLGVLTQLKHISLKNGPCLWECEHAVNAVPLTRLLPFLRIPSLRKLYVKNPCDRSPPSVSQDLSTIPLTHLDFEAPEEGLPNLPRLLERCTDLQSFTLQQNGWSDKYSHCWQDLPRVYRSLQRSRFSIRHLNVTFRDCCLWQDPKTPTPVFFGPLSDFPRLESVHIRWGNLLPFLENRAHTPVTPLWELLPSSLRHLFIDHCLLACSSALYTELKTLLIHYPTHVPFLRTLYLRLAKEREEAGSTPNDPSTWRPISPDPTTHDRLHALREDFRALSIDFRIFQSDEDVNFGQEYYIRKKWPWGQHGKIMTL